MLGRCVVNLICIDEVLEIVNASITAKVKCICSFMAIKTDSYTRRVVVLF